MVIYSWCADNVKEMFLIYIKRLFDYVFVILHVTMLFCLVSDRLEDGSIDSDLIELTAKIQELDWTLLAYYNSTGRSSQNLVETTFIPDLVDDR